MFPVIVLLRVSVGVGQQVSLARLPTLLYTESSSARPASAQARSEWTQPHIVLRCTSPCNNRKWAAGAKNNLNV